MSETRVGIGTQSRLSQNKTPRGNHLVRVTVLPIGIRTNGSEKVRSITCQENPVDSICLNRQRRARSPRSISQNFDLDIRAYGLPDPVLHLLDIEPILRNARLDHQ